MSVAQMALSIFAVNNGFHVQGTDQQGVDFEAARRLCQIQLRRTARGHQRDAQATKENEAALKKCIEDFIATSSTDVMPGHQGNPQQDRRV